MKKKKFIVIAILVLLITSQFFLLINRTNYSNENIKTVDDRPGDDEPYSESRIVKSEITDEQKEIELKYDEYVVANGYIGAADNAYFTRNKILYHLIISTDTVTKIAEGVKKIENDKDTLLVYKGNNFKIIKKDDYITYVN